MSNPPNVIGAAAAAAKLSNADFRQLVMEGKQVKAGPAPAPGTGKSAETGRQNRKKRKELLKAIEERKALEKEQADKYRDRAAERRKGLNNDYEDDMVDDYNEEPADGISAEEKRLRTIEESKFLGGDMEHTHLVKGLDFALLQKMKSEMVDSLENLEDEGPEKPAAEAVTDDKEQVICRTRVAKGVYNHLFAKHTQVKNELFFPGRMAYFVDLENTKANLMEAPTTVIRSKADCPEQEAATKATTNEIVIGKLTQILSYLRQGTRTNKRLRKKKDKDKDKDKSVNVEKRVYVAPVDTDLQMFEDGDDDVLQIKPSLSLSNEGSKKKSYFSSNSNGDLYAGVGDNPTTNKSDASVYVKDVLKQFGSTAKDKEGDDDDDGVGGGGGGHDDEDGSTSAAVDIVKNAAKRSAALKKKLAKLDEEDRVPDSYAECYPGGMDMVMNAYDSDEEKKMEEERKAEDAAKEEETAAAPDDKKGGGGDGKDRVVFKKKGKKGEVSGEKLNRKQRRALDQKVEDKRLDKEMNEINKFIEKRKADQAAGGEKEAKKSKKK